MRETPRRVILSIIALALITVFVIGATELASDQEPVAPPQSPVAADTSQPTTETEPTTNSSAEPQAAETDQEASASGQTPVHKDSSEARASHGLPSTGSGGVLTISVGLSALAIVSRAYVLSRAQLRRHQRREA